MARKNRRDVGLAAAHIRVHRPVVCEICKAEMGEYPGWAEWWKCPICGAKRREDG